jgi:hypothetical protein
MGACQKSKLYLTVSVVLYNSPLPFLQRTMESLQRSVQVAQQSGCLDRVTVFLIDNSSQEPYRARLTRALVGWSQSEYFKVRYIPAPINGGFAYGHNIALQFLTSDFHLVLNPDVELEENTLRVGLSSLWENDDVALMSPLVFGRDGKQEFLCKRYPSVLVLLLRGFAPLFIRRLFHQRLADYEMRYICKANGQVNVAIASGCFMLIRTPALLAVNGFNDEFFLYFEDFDLSLRLRKEGRLVFNSDMRIVHHGGYAAKKGRLHLQYFLVSAIRFFNRHGWRWV